MSNLVDVVRRYSALIKNGRNLRTICDHMVTEVNELDLEITLARTGMKPGTDGVVGEAIDVIACALDVIFVERPDITDEELAAIMERKCKKWADNYS